VGEDGYGRSDVPVDMAMEIATLVTTSATETAGATIFELLKRNENGKRRKRSEAQPAPSDWRSHTERTI